jgi:hypothetical protein
MDAQLQKMKQFVMGLEENKRLSREVQAPDTAAGSRVQRLDTAARSPRPYKTTPLKPRPANHAPKTTPLKPRP